MVITHTLYNEHNEFVGVVGIDLSLTSITENLSYLNFGETDYILLIESIGRILTNSKYENDNFKFVRDMENQEFRNFYYSQAEHAEIIIDDTPYYVTKFQPEIGYTLVSVVQKSEVLHADPISDMIKYLIAAIFLFFVLVAAYVGVRIVRNMDAEEHSYR